MDVLSVMCTKRSMRVCRTGALHAPNSPRLQNPTPQEMEQLGDPVLKPFLQDVIQLGPLARTMWSQMTRAPLFVPQVCAQSGVGRCSVVGCTPRPQQDG